MGAGNYDSAQYWLNKIHEKISYRKPSLFSYFLTIRQAEVYYYNDLQQLGLQESSRALHIAETLNEKVLIADACNFCGLFLSNMGRFPEAVEYFKKGISICSQPPYSITFLDVSNPHHLYGNLSEAFEKMNQPDSAIVYGRLSLQKAHEINHDRGVATASLNLGTSFMNLGNIDSAIAYFTISLHEALLHQQADIELACYGYLGHCGQMKNNREDALGFMDKGLGLLHHNANLNSFYTQLFIDQAIAAYKYYKSNYMLALAMQLKSDIQAETQLKSNQQYKTILSTALDNETRIFNMELAKAKQEQNLAITRLYIAALVFLLVIAGFVAYRYYALQKLKLANLRNKISQDLHDEVGATLSGIALYSYITRQQSDNNDQEQVAKSLGIIEKNATGMVKKLNDIVWAVNPAHDSLTSLMHRLEEYAIEAAAPKNISVKLSQDQELHTTKLSMDQRKNIYLICKESVNNAVKYSGATLISIKFSIEQNLLLVIISDNGQGFDLKEINRGNGLNNMEARASEINAVIKIESRPTFGTQVLLECKIT